MAVPTTARLVRVLVTEAHRENFVTSAIGILKKNVYFTAKKIKTFIQLKTVYRVLIPPLLGQGNVSTCVSLFVCFMAQKLIGPIVMGGIS